MLGRSELSVRTRCRHLLEKFFVNVPHRVLVGQLHRTHVGNDAHKHLRRGDKEHGVLHVAAEGRIVLVAAKPLDELKNIVPHRLKHLRRIGVREAAPPEPLVVARDKRLFGNDALTLLEYRVLHGGSESIGIRLAHKLVVVQQLHEKQIRDLLHHRNWACDTRRPEGIPDLIDLPLKFAGYHAPSPVSLTFVSGTYLAMSPISHLSAPQIFSRTAAPTASPFVIFASVVGERPVALRKSARFMSRSMSNFQSFL